MTTTIGGTTGVTFPDTSTQNTAATGFGFKNRIINGAMAINQRGTQTGSPLNGYTLDRWMFSRTGSGGSTVSQSSTANYGGQYALTISSAHAAGEVFGIEQRIEAANSFDLAGKTVTVQFYASATTSAGALGTFSVSASYANATDNFSSATAIGSVTFVPTSTPTLFTAQFSIPSAATTGLKLQIGGGQVVATGTIAFNLGGVQLEKGSTATSFDYRPYGTELALCQRYLPAISYAGGTNPYFGAGMAYSTTAAYYTIAFPVTPRVPPTGLTVSSASHFAGFLATTATSNATAVPFGGADSHSAFVGLTGMSGLVAGNATLIYMSSSSALMLFTGCEL